MKTFTSSAAVRIAAMALATASAAALAGCENPQPTAAPEQATAAPPPSDGALMGAPAPGAQSPEPPAQTGPGEIVAMAPIPNPPAQGLYYGRWYGPKPKAEHPRHPRVHVHVGPAAAVAAHAARRHHHHPHPAVAAAKPAHRGAPSRLALVHPAPNHAAPVRPAPAPAPVKPHPAPATHHPAAGAAATAAAGSHLAKPPTSHRRHVDEATTTAAAGGPTNTAANATDNQVGNVTGTEADRYKALEASLHDAFESVAVLTVPAGATPGKAETVTLTLPSDFAAAVQRDAAQQGLSDAAASMNLLATLSGDGYTITPSQSQSVALSTGQLVSFQWQVTPGTGATGPLKADVRAQAVSAGQYLDLGDKTQGGGATAGKVVGVGLLLLIAAIILGWAFRRKPAPAQPVVKRPAYDQYPPTPPSKP